jgi:RNA polymerase sigma-70 factor (ECF subfamily)
MPDPSGPSAEFKAELLVVWPQLVGYCVRKTRSADAGEDLAQDVAFLACRGWRSYQPGTNMKAWLYQIAGNALITKARKAARTQLLPTGVVEDWTEGVEVVRPAAPSRLDLGDVIREMRAMPAEMVEAMIDVALGDRYDVSAMRRGVAIGTIKSRVSRGRAHLREALTA